MDEVDRAVERRIERIARRRGLAGAGKDAGVAQVQSDLGPELGPERDRVPHRAGHRLVDEVGLVEGVLAIGDVVIGAVGERAVVHGAAGKDILVTAVEVRDHGRVPARQPVAEIVLDDHHGRIGIDPRVVVLRAAEKRAEIAVRHEWRGRIEARARADRGIAAVGGFLVMIIFEAELDRGVVVRLQRHGRIDAVALELVEVAKRVGTFVEGVETHGDVLVHGLPRVERDAAVAPGAGLGARLVARDAVGLLQRAVQHAAAGAAAEHQRARPFQNLDALGVVDVAIILDVVAEAVDEEVGAGIDAADDQLVAIALALMHRDARHVT